MICTCICYCRKRRERTASWNCQETIHLQFKKNRIRRAWFLRLSRVGLSHQNRSPPKWSPRTDFGRNFAKTGRPDQIWQPKSVPDRFWLPPVGRPVLAAKSGPPFKWIVRRAAINFQPFASLHAGLHWHAMALHACIAQNCSRQCNL